MSRYLPPPQRAPVEQWQPDKIATSELRIDRAGQWYRAERLLTREDVVLLMAGTLRRDEGQYFLVTPPVKTLIEVETTPFLIVDFVQPEPDRLIWISNLNQRWQAEGPQELQMQGEDWQVTLDRGLQAQLTRAAFYRLVEQAVARDGRYVFPVGDWHFDLGVE